MAEKLINLTPIHTQEATCGLQVCQHPMCWATNRAAVRGLLRQTANDVGEFQDDKETSADNASSIIDDEEDMFEGLPTVKILNMLDDYGYDKSDHYPTNWAAESHRQILSRKSRTMQPERADVMPKLTLKSLASQSVDDVMAPANTPLQSAHGFGDYHYYQRSPLGIAGGNRKINSFKHLYTDANASSNNSVVDGKHTNYNKVKMELDSSQCMGNQRNKYLVWCPASNSRRVKQTDVIERPAKVPSLRAVSLPLEQVPKFKSKATLSRQALRSTQTKKLVRLPYKKQKKATENASTSPPAQMLSSSRTTPREIEQLRKIPVDVLLRVLHQAEANSVITPKQTNFLLRQVTGKKEKLPLIQESPTKDETKPPKNREESTPPLETKNIKILDVQEVRQRSPRTMSTEAVYKLDLTSRNLPSRGLIPPATETVMYNITTEVNVTQSTGQDLLGEREEKLKGNDWNETESQYNIQLREVAAENLRSIGALRRVELSTPKKTPVKLIATVFDQTVPQTPPIKPFHYPKSPRDMFLGPIPSPPPPTPPTERDSSYDEEVGGSTVMVNVPSTGPPTLTSNTEKMPSSPSGGSRTPTTERDDNRNIKMNKNESGIHNSQSRRLRAVSPYGSATNVDLWPQVNEDEYLHGGSQPRNSPMLSFVDEEIHSVSRNEFPDSPESSASGEKPMVEKFQDIHPGEIHSPAPPPPSPEVPPQPVLDVPLTQPQASANDMPLFSRTRGAATALGLIALRKTPSDASPDTEGFTPTPIVSSATTSEVETPVGRLTRSRGLGSTPAIAETPFENEDLESNEERSDKSKDSQDPVNECSEPDSSKSVNKEFKAIPDAKRDSFDQGHKEDKQLNRKIDNLD